jgi:hypothetical protein
MFGCSISLWQATADVRCENSCEAHADAVVHAPFEHPVHLANEYRLAAGFGSITLFSHFL